MNKRTRLVYAISLSGLFIAMSIILQRFLVIPFGVSSLYRISLGSVPIIMASLFLGPVFGGLVGFSSDLLGATLFPVDTLIPWPLISSTMYGVLPWLLLKGVKFIKGKTNFPFFYIFIALFVTLIEVFVLVNDSIRHPFDKTLPAIQFTPLFRLLFTGYLVLMLTLLIISFVYLEKRFKQYEFNNYTLNPSSLAFALLVMGVIVDVIYSSVWKESVFGVSFFVSVFFHASIILFLLPFQTLLLTILGNVYSKIKINYEQQ